jgi:hypothetical protein
VTVKLQYVVYFAAILGDLEKLDISADSLIYHIHFAESLATEIFVAVSLNPCCCCLLQEDFFIKFAEFEEMVKETERARAIFKYALDHLPKAQAEHLYQRFVTFEKQHGDRWVKYLRWWRRAGKEGVGGRDGEERVGRDGGRSIMGFELWSQHGLRGPARTCAVQFPFGGMQKEPWGMATAMSKAAGTWSLQGTPLCQHAQGLQPLLLQPLNPLHAALVAHYIGGLGYSVPGSFVRHGQGQAAHGCQYFSWSLSLCHCLEGVWVEKPGELAAVFVYFCHREGIEDVVLSKRRFQYEQEIEKDPLNYDAWFDYVKLEESTGNQERIREVCGVGGEGKLEAYGRCCMQKIIQIGSAYGAAVGMQSAGLMLDMVMVRM